MRRIWTWTHVHTQCDVQRVTTKKIDLTTARTVSVNQDKCFNICIILIKDVIIEREVVVILFLFTITDEESAKKSSLESRDRLLLVVLLLNTQ